MAHDQLERLFVAREAVLDAIMARIRAAANGNGRNHTLLVGPRGAGKTHLVALAYHRASALRVDGEPIQLSWLPEDAWTIVSYRHLLTSIIDRLEPTADTPTSRDVGELEAFIAARAADAGPIVVFIENLDQVLAAIGNHGQQQLRHLLQSSHPMLLVSTSTRLDRSLSDQSAPFYGFFTTTRLEPLDVEQAAAMLTRIAEERADAPLADYLDTPEGLARLRTITHLAGGQPRIWALLASALTVDGLGELVELLLSRFDDLTPYYQEQLGRLSPQQRLIVAELAEADRPLNVSALAHRLEVDQRSLAKTMHELVNRGWIAPTDSRVASMLDQRRTYYELAEPLARISFQIKDARGEPLRLIVDFLKNWFDPPQLSAAPVELQLREYIAMAAVGQDRDPVVAVTRRLNRLPITRCPAVDLLAEIDDALAAVQHDDAGAFLELPTPVRAALEERLANCEDDITTLRCEIHQAALAEFGDVPHPSMPAWISRGEELLASAPGPVRTDAQYGLAEWLLSGWRFLEAEAVVAAIAESLGAEHRTALDGRDALAFAYVVAGRPDLGIAVYEQTLATRERVLGAEDPSTLVTRVQLGAAYLSAGRLQAAIGMFEQTLVVSERVLGPHHRDALVARTNLARAHTAVARYDAAVAVLEPTVAECERLLGVYDHDTLVARSHLANAYDWVGMQSEAIGLLQQNLAINERVLIAHHPTTLATRNNLANVYASAGRLDEAIELLEGTLIETGQVFGRDHPNTQVIRVNLGTAYAEGGRLDEAIALLERAFVDCERTLGAEHPQTAVAADRLTRAMQQRVR